MKKLKKIYSFVVIFCIILSVVGCITERSGSSIQNNYLLINNTNKSLYYESHDDGELTFDTILSPNDTLFLYWKTYTLPSGDFGDSAGFSSDIVIIKNNDEYLLFYKGFCGKTDFVAKRKNNDNYYYYWTIDSAYIADKSCNMSLEEFERDYLNNE